MNKETQILIKPLFLSISYAVVFFLGDIFFFQNKKKNKKVLIGAIFLKSRQRIESTFEFEKILHQGINNLFSVNN